MQPETILLLILGVALTLYVLLAGADFGAGVWEFNTAFRATREEREQIYRAIGPVWEANHVWLIFVIVLLFTAFPPAFAAISRALWAPLLLGLAGIVFRGAAFAFRSYDSARRQPAWDVVFALASTAAPFFLGAAVGAIASGTLAITPSGEFTGDYWTGWIGVLSAFTAFFVVGLCAYLAAVYLAREASDARASEESMVGARPASDRSAAWLENLWRRRAIATGIWLGVLAMIGLALVAGVAPGLWEKFDSRAWPLFGVSLIAGLGSLAALWRRSYRVATVGAGAATSTVVWGWLVAQYPALIPPSITVESAKAPASVLWAMLLVIGVGLVFLVPALMLLMYLFKGRRPPETS